MTALPSGRKGWNGGARSGLGRSSERYFERGAGIAALWFGLLAAPAAWLLHLLISYSLVRLICDTGELWLLHATTIATLSLAAAGVWTAWRSWRRVGEPQDARGSGTLGRSRFLALAGLALSGFFLVVIAMAWLPDFFLSPCGS